MKPIPLPSLDIAIRAGWALLPGSNPLKSPFQIVRDVLIGIQGDTIALIEPWNLRAAHTSRLQPECREWIDASRHAVLPGLINGHMHLPMSLFRGLSDDLPLQDWLEKRIFPLEAAFVSPEFVRAGTELAALESLRFGTTTVCDMYYFEDTIAEVIDRSGLRGVLGQALLDFPSPDHPNPNVQDLSRFDQFRARWAQHARITPAIAPHAPYTCGDPTLRQAAQYSKDHQIPLLIHVAETLSEVEASKKQWGQTPVERLHALGVTHDQAIFAHGTHLSDSDIELLARTGTSVIYNPESNMKLGAGAAPIRRLRDAGVKVGIGTDGAASNNDLSLFREMDSGAKLQKLVAASNTEMTATHALELATHGGAKALGLSRDQRGVGRLETGQLADLICVNLDQPHLQPVHDVISQLVYACSGHEVDHVIVHGRVLLRQGHPTSLDAEKIKAEAVQWGERILRHGLQ